MAIYYLFNNGFTQLAPKHYRGRDAKKAINLERVLGGLMQTSSTGGTHGYDMQVGVWNYLSACGISGPTVQMTMTDTPNLDWFQTALAPNVAQDPDTIVLANFGVTWFVPVQGEQSTYKAAGGHFLTPLIVHQKTGKLTLNNPAPSTFIAGAARSAKSNPQTVTISAVPAEVTLQGISNPQDYCEVITDKLGTGQGMLAVLVSANAWSIPVAMLASPSWKPNSWQISSPRNSLLLAINTNGGDLDVSAPIEGVGGIAKSGEGTLTLLSTNSLSGANFVSNGTLASTQFSTFSTGSITPFGTGPITLSGGGVLMFCPANSASVTATIASSDESVCMIAGGGGTIALAGKGSFKVTLGGNSQGSKANIDRQSAGTLVIAPGAGIAELGATQQLLVAGNGGNLPPVTNGMVAPYIIGQDDYSTPGWGCFLTYGVTGFTQAGSDVLQSGPGSSTTIYTVSSPDQVELDGTVEAWALAMSGGEISGKIGGSANLLIGSQASGDSAGLIMNGGIIDTGVTVTFGDAEGVIYTSSEGSINAAIAGTAGLTLFGPGTLVLGADNSSTLSGTINVNAGTLVAAVDGATGPSGGATDIVNVNTGATLEEPVQGVAKSAVTIGQSGVLSLSGGTVAGTLSIDAIGQHSDAPGGILQGGGTISGTATIGGVIQCGPTVGLITFTGEEATIFERVGFLLATAERL